jgi:hypothetical protein
MDSFISCSLSLACEILSLVVVVGGGAWNFGGSLTKKTQKFSASGKLIDRELGVCT